MFLTEMHRYSSDTCVNSDFSPADAYGLPGGVKSPVEEEKVSGELMRDSSPLRKAKERALRMCGFGLRVDPHSPPLVVVLPERSESCSCWWSAPKTCKCCYVLLRVHEEGLSDEREK